eukprot:14367898-Alexandrium_andersonii.AAC.1
MRELLCRETEVARALAVVASSGSSLTGARRPGRSPARMQAVWPGTYAAGSLGRPLRRAADRVAPA